MSIMSLPRVFLRKSGGATASLSSRLARPSWGTATRRCFHPAVAPILQQPQSLDSSSAAAGFKGAASTSAAAATVASNIAMTNLAKNNSTPARPKTPKKKQRNRPRSDRNNNYYQATPFSLEQLRPCTTMSTCEHYNLAKAIEILHEELGLRNAAVLIPGEIAHVSFPHSWRSSADATDVLILGSSGSVVGWGMTESEMRELVVEPLRRAEVGSYGPEAIESEDMDFVTATSTDPDSGVNVERSTMVGDVMVVSDNIKDPILVKAAFSSGLARSTKLATLENRLEAHLSATKDLIDNLAAGRELGIRGTKLLQLTGELLSLRGQLNLHSELIETPDLYWEEPELEQLYSLISRKLDVATRIAILNKKLDYASESINVLKSHLSEEQGVRLEWMIIILIMVEVGFEIFHFVEHWYEKQAPSKKEL